LLIGYWLLAIGILVLPGYFTLRLPFWGETNHTQTTFGQRLFLSLLISVLISGLIGLVLAQVGIFSLGSLLLALGAYSVLCVVFITVSGRIRRHGDTETRRHGEFAASPRLPLSASLPLPLSVSPPLRSVRLGWEDAIVIVLLCLSLLLYARPAEYILGWLDAGWYVNAGAHIAETGSLSGESRVFSSLPPSAKPLFYRSFASLKGMFPYFPDTESRGIYLWAFAVADPDRGKLTAYHPPLFSVWIAIFYAIGGLRFCLYTTPAFGALSVLSLYFAGKAMFGRKVGLLAAVLLAVSFTQIHFSRMPYSEMLSQFLFFSGIYALTAWTGKPVDTGTRGHGDTGNSPRLRVSPSPRLPLSAYAVIAALCFGQAILCRIEGLVVVVPLLMFFGCWLTMKRRLPSHSRFFVIPFGVLIADGALLALTASRPYVELNAYGLWFKLRSLLPQPPALLPLLVVLSGGVIALIVLLSLAKVANTPPIPPLPGGERGGQVNSPSNLRQAEQLRRIYEGRHLMTTLLSLAILIAAIYAYFVRPAPSFLGTGIGSSSGEGGPLAQLAWFVSPFGLWLGVFGLVEMIRRHLNEKTAFFLALVLMHGLATMSVLAISATPSYVYPIRRQVPILIPSLILLASYAILGCGANCQFAPRSRAGLGAGEGKATLPSPTLRTWLRIAQGIAIGVLVISFLALAIPYLNAREMPNTIAFSERLASHFGEQDIVVFEETGVQESLVGHFAAPLWAIYDKNALLMSTAHVEGEAFSAAMAQWLDAGRRVYFVSQSDPPPVPLTGYEFTLVAEDQWRSSTTTMLSAFPPKVLEFEIPFYIYQIVEGASL